VELHVCILGYLVFTSGYTPNILGVVLIGAGLGYLTDSFAHVLLLNDASYATVFLLLVAIPSMIGNLSRVFWLLFKDGTAQRPDTRALQTARIADTD